MNYEALTIKELKNLYSKKSISFLELIDLQIAYIKKTEKNLLSLVNFDEELYLKEAKDFNSENMSKGYLENVPIGVKDLIDIKGMRTEANSKSLASVLMPLISIRSERHENRS